ncbi:phosphomannomutase/phosphoglucomutase, partial [Aliarcobacter butzleri]
STNFEININEKDKFKIIKKIDEKLKTIQRGFPIIKDIVKIDGLRINFEYGLALIRASNTNSVIVTKYVATSYATAMSYKVAVENI